MTQLSRPSKRGFIRQFLGKEYFILKRKFKWCFGKERYVSEFTEKPFGSSKVFQHRSLVLRPLKDVDMYLQENKRKNLELAIAKINGVVIKPKETFSLWKLVGRPSKLKGYLEGMVLKQGQVITGTGGGLCQLGNLLFWVIGHSPLVVTERYRHGYDVFPDVNRKVPFGAGATLSYNYIDFQFYNPTDQAFCLKLWLDDTHLNGALYAEKEIKVSYRLEERGHQMKQQYWGGYSRHNQIFKIEESDGLVQQESLLVENHAIMMYNPFLES